MKIQAKKKLSAGLCGVLALTSLIGCGNDSSSRNLMDDVPPAASSFSAPDSPAAPSFPASDSPAADAVTCTDFAVRLFQECIAGAWEQAQKPRHSEVPQTAGNTLISPLSVMNALAMTAAGARGQTLEQMEALFGTDLSSLRDYLHGYNDRLPSDRKYRLHLANSIWLKDSPDLTVSPDFLQTNADYFKAGLYTAPFDDSTTKDINNWVSENTEKMIPDILDRISDNTVIYLVNALAFDAEWETIYESSQVLDGIFTCENGTARNVEMMYSEEHAYLKGTNAQGFLKFYSDGKYAFAALLPEEGISLDDYIASLTGQGLHEMLTNYEPAAVRAAIPKFKTTWDILLNQALESMGMTDAFDPDAADLSGLGSSPAKNLYISRVLHKTYLAVDEKGTRAGAATAVEVRAKGAMKEPEELKIVCLDRPFLYMIIDCEEKIPVFMGTVNDPTR